MNTTIDGFFANGCGRCPLGGTPQCKVLRWTPILQAVRAIILTREVQEEVKWGVPCYTHQGSNVLNLSALKDSVVVGFFKGSLLVDPTGLLQKPGPRSQAVRRLHFEQLSQVEEHREHIQSLVQQAIELEVEGAKVAYSESSEPLPKELCEYFLSYPKMEHAFGNLTPGRQRGYLIYFNSAKQAKTRIGRITKCAEKILRGEGMHDHYQAQRKKI